MLGLPSLNGYSDPFYSAVFDLMVSTVALTLSNVFYIYLNFLTFPNSILDCGLVATLGGCVITLPSEFLWFFFCFFGSNYGLYS